jgi:hypothetical protein
LLVRASIVPCRTSTTRFALWKLRSKPIDMRTGPVRSEIWRIDSETVHRAKHRGPATAVKETFSWRKTIDDDQKVNTTLRRPDAHAVDLPPSLSCTIASDMGHERSYTNELRARLETSFVCRRTGKGA